MLMVAAPVLWSTAGVVTRHIERATAFELVFWRSFFAFVFVLAALLFFRRNPLKAGWPVLVSGAMWSVISPPSCSPSPSPRRRTRSS